MSGKSQAELEFLDGDRAGEVVPLEAGRTVIGRQVGDLLIEDKEISSIHAIISFERGGWYVMDLGSTNGVFVDEQVKLEARLSSGMVLRFGQTRATFRFLEDTVSGSEESSVAGEDSVLITLPRIEVGDTMRNPASAEAKKAAAGGPQPPPIVAEEGAQLTPGSWAAWAARSLQPMGASR